MTTATVQASSRTQSGVDELAHLGAVAGEHDEREDGERQLQAENRPG